MSDSNLLKLTNITKTYPPACQDSDAPTVLNGINLELGAGEGMAIVGPSGSGKSTLLNIIAAYIRHELG